MTGTAPPSGPGNALANAFADRRALLARSYIFRDLDGTVIERLAGLCTTRRLPEDGVLFQQGDDGDALYAVISGLVRISVSGSGGRELTLGLMEPGDVFGEIALLDGLPRTATATALEPTMLLTLRRETFLPVLRQDGRLALHLIELLCERLRDNTDRLSEHAFLDLRSRLARKLESLAIAHGRQTEHGLAIALKISQTDLAQMLGVTREAVNKQIKAWTKAGVIKNERGRITVVDMARLSASGRLDDRD